MICSLSCWAMSLTISDQFSTVQSLSRVQLFATPWAPARQASPSITNSQSPPKPTSIESKMPSNHLILSSPSPPALSRFTWKQDSSFKKRLSFQLSVGLALSSSVKPPQQGSLAGPIRPLKIWPLSQCHLWSPLIAYGKRRLMKQFLLFSYLSQPWFPDQLVGV